jgi:hypothetical protein
VVGKTDTRIRDGPDGTQVRETVPGIGTRITLLGHPFVYGVQAVRTADGPRLRELHIDLAGARCSADAPTHVRSATFKRRLGSNAQTT